MSDNITLKYQYELALKQEKEFTKQVLIVYFLNAVKLGFFCYLAYYFNHWWISLFGVLFQQSFTRYVRTDDKGENINDEERN